MDEQANGQDLFNQYARRTPVISKCGGRKYSYGASPTSDRTEDIPRSPSRRTRMHEHARFFAEIRSDKSKKAVQERRQWYPSPNLLITSVSFVNVSSRSKSYIFDNVAQHTAPPLQNQRVLGKSESKIFVFYNTIPTTPSNLSNSQDVRTPQVFYCSIRSLATRRILSRNRQDRIA